MQRLNFIMGVALLIVAATVAMVITLRPVAPEDVAGSAEPRDGDRPGADAGEFRAGESPAAMPTRGRESLAEAGLAAPQRFTVGVPDGHPEAAALGPKAARVEEFANTRLDQLTARLDLTADQRRKLFPILARTSESYHPAMQIAGVVDGAPALSGAAGDAALTEVLVPGQQDQLVEHAITDSVLWQEIIAGLQRQLEAQTPQVPEGGEPPPPPDPPPRRNIFDVVEPGR